MFKQPIAIIGMSCRFPKVQSLQDFWNLLKNGEETIEEINRWDIQAYFNSDKSARDKTHQRHSSMLKHIDDFDPLFFNISPAEAAEMSPSQKLMMELVWECIENSNTAFDHISGKKVGVYVGNIWSDFEHLRKHKYAEVTSHSAVGQSANIIANRISFFYGFSGPSLVVDTGCSSSLVALHLACQSLWDGSTEQGIVGGINHMLDPDQNILLSKFGGLSARGKCSTFDENADGFVRGEGGGVLLLKRLSDAERDGDHIYAVIKGSAINNNGFNENLPATSVKGQMDVLEEAYRDSGIQPHEVHYVEAHGTGTQLGDPTESKALGTFFSKNRKKPLHVGSVKTNIGHLEGAAGMAGLIKTVLAINNNSLPKNLNFNKPNPKIDFNGLNLKVQAKHTPWPVVNGETRKAGINSFGWGGTNGHTVIEEYRPTKDRKSTRYKHHHQFVLPISARSEKALVDYARAYKHHLEFNINGIVDEFINVATAAALRRPRFEFGKLFAADGKLEMIEKLDSYIKDPDAAFSTLEKQKIVFVFPGQGSQWIGMGRELYKQEPVFRKMIDKCEAAFSKYCDWSLIAQLQADADTGRLDEINVIQPALFAMQVALARLWQSFGIEPDAVTGHSMGEVAAAYISGSISLSDAAKVICTRSSLMKTVSGKGGAMAVTELTVAEANEIIKKYRGLSVAVNNSPKSTVIAGDQSMIEALLEELAALGKFCKQVKVDVASHSEQMEPLKDSLAQAIKDLKPQKNTIALYSTVKNQEVSGETLTAAYWVNNLRNGVQFAGVMEELIKNEYNVFIEVSPHPVLTTSINECMEAFKGNGLVSGSLYRNKPETDELYSNFDLLYQQGLKVNWKKFYNDPIVPFVTLPPYPFQRATYSLTERKVSLHSKREGHLWIAKEVKLAQMNHVHFWEAQLGLDEFPFLKDHTVAGKVVLPGVAYVEMLHAAVAQLTGRQQLDINSLMFKSAIVLSNDEKTNIQLKIEDKAGENKFHFYELNNDQWVETANGTYQLNPSHKQETNNTPDFEGTIPPAALYQQLQSLGLNYGPDFQGIAKIKTDGNHILAAVRVKENLRYHLSQYGFHPAVLDACMQTLFTTQTNTTDKAATTYLTGIDTLQILGSISFCDELLVSAEITRQETSGGGQLISLTANATIADVTGKVLLKIKGLSGKIFRVEDAQEAKDKWYHHIKWIHGQPELKDNSRKSCLVVAPESTDDITPFLSALREAGHDLHLTNTQEEITNIDNIDEIIYFDNTREDPSSTKPALDLIRFLQCLESKKLLRYPKLTVITHGAYSIKSAHINMSTAQVIGVSRVAANELSQYELQTIDLSYNPNVLELKTLAQLITQRPSDEKEVAIRNEEVYFARLEHYEPELCFDKNTFSGSGYHLITGYKGIAFTVVEWMFTRGARNFCLLSRSNTMDRALESRVRALVKQGARFKIVDCDVCDSNSLSQVLDTLENEAGLKSIVHAAGLIKPEQITELTAEEFDRITGPKVQGAWHLHQASKNYQLDHFIMFSSASCLLGLSGQASYVAANTFLDALAAYRQKQHLPALSINWGVMTDAGMVASAKNLEKFAEAEGFIATEMQTAVEAFDSIFDRCPANMGVFRLEAEKTAEHFPALGASNYLSAILLKKETTGEGQSLIKRLENVPNADEWLKAFEIHLKKLTASIIKTSEDQLSISMKFKSLGIDSLMAVQFRNKLEKELNIKLSVVDIWEHPTISEYASFLVEKLFKVNAYKDKAPSEPAISASIKTSVCTTQLVCFHDAGGNASLYEGWDEKLNDDIQLITVELPGRGQSSSLEPFLVMKHAIQKITDALIGIVDQPVIFFGHSMGGLLAFEVIRELRRRKKKLPVTLIVSSTPQLGSYDRRQLDHTMDDKVLTRRFPHLSQKAIADDELRSFLIQLLRNDLALLDSYQYQFEPPVDVEIIGIHGKSDETVSKKQVELWSNETTMGFRLVQRDGDHHYLRACTDFVTQLINNEMNNRSPEYINR
ncbi:Malonyl CoA-acyl carrier protein transacylase [Fulvivirga imtechensis AK7]|uniref:Malonyl CoA-acyl carrier protein transacylase n=1 Tax=Fulvivirga imtechensis AK7 TaxID=1237149 RepID=L8JW78_9BACT|nr:type I polyketide synthase [Fulvivirga imtechensis]ELR73055.1 Malonyl CoA-acyl carrier protein transacylase [Fulvivirga imtechensis AK7]